MAKCRINGGAPIYASDTAGWGTPLSSYMSIPVVNAAITGHSARLAYQDRMYDDALNKVQPGDYVLLQWGRNDGEWSR